MALCDTAPLTLTCTEPWLGTQPRSTAHSARFLLSSEGLEWYPAQLEHWSQAQLLALADAVRHYATQRAD